MKKSLRFVIEIDLVDTRHRQPQLQFRSIQPPLSKANYDRSLTDTTGRCRLLSSFLSSRTVVTSKTVLQGPKNEAYRFVAHRKLYSNEKAHPTSLFAFVVK